jgi:hypothetical protein
MAGLDPGEEWPSERVVLNPLKAWEPLPPRSYLHHLHWLHHLHLLEALSDLQV